MDVGLYLLAPIPDSSSLNTK